MDVVQVSGLVKRYGEVEAIRGASFPVRRGEIFGLLGPNGAGKTSTIEILVGLRARDAGEVEVLGLDPGVRRQLQLLRQRVGVVLQQSGHYRYLTVAETIRMHSAWYADPRSVDEVLALTGLDGRGSRRVRALSGGEQRRLDVAVALVGRPELIFLDEPTTGFDPAARRRAWDTIAALRDLGTTIILTTHYMEEAQALADRVGVMRDGSLVAVGTPDELASSLRLRSRLTFRLPAGIGLADLPSTIASQLDEAPDGRLTMGCTEPTRALADLCGWAAARGVELEEMELVRPSLEQSYLTLTNQPHTQAVPT